jgi:hypothetical protein
MNQTAQVVLISTQSSENEKWLFATDEVRPRAGAQDAVLAREGNPGLVTQDVFSREK